MVVQYELTGPDLAQVRFAISPLNELVLSLRTWRNPGGFPAHLPWMHQVEAARERLDADLLLALISDGSTPDCLTPRPTSPLTRVQEQFDQLADLDPARIVAEARALHESCPAVLRGSTRKVSDRILTALQDYWEQCFAPHWPRMRALLEADVMYRAQVMAGHGLGEMLAGLSHNLRFADDVVSVQLRRTDYRRPVEGTGLTLVPCLFNLRASIPIGPDEDPMIQYPVRGLGTLWQVPVQRASAPAALAALLGPTRARLLAGLGEPTSSTELARRLGVTVPAANQHLRALRDGGLLSSARYGRAVLYRRSDLGDALLGSGSQGHPPPGR